MNNSFSFIIVVFLLGAVQGVFLALLLLNKRGNKTVNRFLAVLMISYSAFIAESALTETEVSMQFPHLLGLTAGIIFLFGPLYYLYALSLRFSGFKFSKKNLLHFIPFASFYLYYLFLYFLKSGEEKITFIQNMEMNYLNPWSG